MHTTGTVAKHVDSIAWQDYRASETGMIVYYNTDPVSELPIREVPEELPSEVVADPHYETVTFGVYGCGRNKVRSAFVKAKARYLFFMTRYEGTKGEYFDRLFVTGFYRVGRTADVQKIHIRYLLDYSCIGTEKCIALRADEAAFVSVEDALELTPEVLQGWGAGTRVTKQTRILLDADKTAQLLEQLRSKTNIIDAYAEETERLQPATELDEEDEDEFEDADPQAPADDNDDKIVDAGGAESGADTAEPLGASESATVASPVIADEATVGDASADSSEDPSGGEEQWQSESPREGGETLPTA